MALTKEMVIDRITATQFGDLEIRERTAVLEDGKELSYSYHRRVISAGEDVSKEDARLQALYNAAQLNKVARPVV